MQSKTNYQSRIIRGRTELWVPHLDGEIAFAYPSVGKGTYRNVGNKILEYNQEVPTGDYTASLLHAAYCSDSSNEPEFQNLKETMRNRWLWVYNKNLWTDKGVYVVQDEKAKGRSEDLDIKSLEEILKSGKEIQGVRFSSDGKVRFAPKGSYASGSVTSEQFVKDGFVIASFGKDGAEKLSEFFTKFKNQAYIYTLDVQEGQKLRVSTVDGHYGGLKFGGVWFGDDYEGHAFGVLK